jgi:flagellar biosynthesis protein FlhA
MSTNTSTEVRFFSTSHMAIAAGMMTIVASIILPLPPFLVDILLALSLALSLVVFLTVAYTKKPLDFNFFPSVLVLLTLFRIGLNVSTTKLILGEAYAGRMVDSFANLVVRGNLVVGFAVYCVILAVTFLVITKGASRISEVAARFRLDAMPGRQMAIDAELQAGMIDEKQARSRRQEIDKDADFYGRMDGAAKAVRGEAIAGLVITAINLLAGLAIGVAMMDMSVGEAAAVYTKMTIGDGLVSQFPSLLVGAAAAFLITHAAGDETLGEGVLRQLTQHSHALWISALILAALAIVPGMPAVPLLLLAAALLYIGRVARQRAEEAEQAPHEDGDAGAPVGGIDEQPDILQLDALEMQVGLSLFPLVDPRTGSDLIQRITAVRRTISAELGLVVPPVRVRDNRDLAPNEYVILLQGVEVARAEILPGCLLAIDTGDLVDTVPGVKNVREPSFGTPAVWIRPEHRIDAEVAGYTVVEPATVLVTHLQQTIRSNVADLLGREEVQQILTMLGSAQPALVKDVVPEKVTHGVLQKVLQSLLREGVPIRNMTTILEAMSDAVDQNIREPERLVREVRRSLARVIASVHADEDGVVRGITISPELQVALINMYAPKDRPGPGAVPPAQIAEIVPALVKRLEHLALIHRREGRYAPVICEDALRVAVRRIANVAMPSLPVISYAEVPNHVPIESIATWGLETDSPVAQY